MRPPVSIIIPVYNAENTLARCLDSILANSYKNYDVILVDDGSHDRSLSIANKYKNFYSEKIRIYRQKNCGVAVARNKGMIHATSKYIMFIDDDDYIDRRYIETYFTLAEKSYADIVIGGYKRINDTKALYTVKLKDTPWSHYKIMAPWGKMYKRTFIEKNALTFLDNNIGEDVYFNLQAINLTDKISITDYCGYNWYYNIHSVSNTTQKNKEEKLHVLHLLNLCHKKLTHITTTDRTFVAFYFTRYIIWYLLFVGRKSHYSSISQEYCELFSWLEKHYPHFMQNQNISPFLPLGETIKNRLVVYCFMQLHRMRVIPIFLRLYAKTWK